MSFLFDLLAYPTTPNPLLLLLTTSYRAAGSPTSPTSITFDDASSPSLLIENSSNTVKAGVWYAWAPNTASVLVQFGSALSGERHSIDAVWIEHAAAIGDTDTQGGNAQSAQTSVTTTNGLDMALHYLSLGGGNPAIVPPTGYTEVMNDSATNVRDYAAQRIVPSPQLVDDVFFWGTNIDVVLNSIVLSAIPPQRLATPSRIIIP